MEAKKRTSRKVRTGVVVSDRMEKTITVKVEMTSHHPIYSRTIKSFTKFKVHDEKNEAKVGDVVKIAETRPLSRTKRWRLVEVLKK